jgi:hypothetical protein
MNPYAIKYLTFERIIEELPININLILMRVRILNIIIIYH